MAVTTYVSKAGDNGNSGLTPAAPKATIQAALSLWESGGGNICRVASGYYEESALLPSYGGLISAQNTLEGDPTNAYGILGGYNGFVFVEARWSGGTYVGGSPFNSGAEMSCLTIRRMVFSGSVGLNIQPGPSIISQNFVDECVVMGTDRGLELWSGDNEDYPHMITRTRAHCFVLSPQFYNAGIYCALYQTDLGRPGVVIDRCALSGGAAYGAHSDWGTGKTRALITNSTLVSTSTLVSGGFGPPLHGTGPAVSAYLENCLIATNFSGVYFSYNMSSYLDDACRVFMFNTGLPTTTLFMLPLFHPLPSCPIFDVTPGVGNPDLLGRSTQGSAYDVGALEAPTGVPITHAMLLGDIYGTGAPGPSGGALLTHPGMSGGLRG